MHKLHHVEYGDDAPPEYTLLVRVNNNTHGDGERYWELDARVVSIDPSDRKPRNLSDRQPLKDVVLTAQMHDGTNNNEPYAFQVRVDPWKIDLAEAKRILRTLTAIDTGLTKLYERFGSTDDLAGWVLRVMDTCGIQDATIQVQGDPSGWYTRGEYRTIRREYIAGEIAAMVVAGKAFITKAAAA